MLPWASLIRHLSTITFFWGSSVRTCSFSRRRIKGRTFWWRAFSFSLPLLISSAVALIDWLLAIGAPYSFTKYFEVPKKLGIKKSNAAQRSSTLFWIIVPLKISRCTEEIRRLAFDVAVLGFLRRWASSRQQYVKLIFSKWSISDLKTAYEVTMRFLPRIRDFQNFFLEDTEPTKAIGWNTLSPGKSFSVSDIQCPTRVEGQTIKDNGESISLLWAKAMATNACRVFPEHRWQQNRKITFMKRAFNVCRSCWCIVPSPMESQRAPFRYILCKKCSQEIPSIW